MNLEDELQKLFADKEAFDVPVAHDAPDTLVERVRVRRRRRRAAAGTAGVLTMVGVVGIGVAIAANGPTGEPPAESLSVVTTTPPPSATSTTVPHGPGTASTSGKKQVPPKSSTHHRRPVTTTTPPADDEPPPPGNPAPFGPAGFDGLTLGMTAGEAEATGVVTLNSEPGRVPGCPGYDYTNFPRAGGDYAVIVSDANGVVRISSLTNAVTPEGVYRGVSLAKVRATYPDGSGDETEWHVPVPGNPQATYQFFFEGGSLTSMRLDLVGSSCLG